MKFYDVKELNVSDELKEALGDNSIVLEFTENGKLPGKVLMRLKDNELLDKLSGDKYYVYHLDENNNRFDKVAIEIQKSHDGYVEFYINHNSKYVITTEEVKNNEVIGKEDEMLASNAIDTEKETKTDNDNQTYLLLGISFGIIIVLVIIIIIILQRKKSVDIKTNNIDIMSTDDVNEESKNK